MLNCPLKSLPAAAVLAVGDLSTWLSCRGFTMVLKLWMSLLVKVL